MDDREVRKQQLLAALNEARADIRRAAVRWSVASVVLATVFWPLATNQQAWGHTLPLVVGFGAVCAFGMALLYWIALWRYR
jgi:hypothetical protein